MDELLALSHSCVPTGISSEILLQTVHTYNQTLLRILSQFFLVLILKGEVVSELVRNILEEPVAKELLLAFLES